MNIELNFISYKYRDACVCSMIDAILMHFSVLLNDESNIHFSRPLLQKIWSCARINDDDKMIDETWLLLK